MAFNLATGYTPEQLNLFTQGIQNTLRDFKSRYGVLNKTANSTPAVYTPKTYQNVNTMYPNLGLKEGDKVGSLGVITTPYGASTRYENVHQAVDIANKAGTPIPAFASGTVTAVVTGKKHGDPGFGNYVVIRDDQGNYHRYSHLQSAYVPINSRVSKGTVIGGMGATGQTYSRSGDPKRLGEHLDYRVYTEGGKKLNPFAYIMSDYYKSLT